MREFFHLVGYSLRDYYIDSGGSFLHNAMAYQVCFLKISKKEKSHCMRYIHRME